jgi:GTP-binding protein LepA
VERIPPPAGDPQGPLRALVYDAKPDPHRGVIVHLRMFDGRVAVGDKVDFMGVGRTYHVTELGKFTPKMTQVKQLVAGEVGYLVGSIKVLADVNIGDTVTLTRAPVSEALPGYRPPQQMVFCDFYPGPDTRTDQLREALEKLWLNDSSFTYAPATSDALGIGFRCGFLGLLHMKIIQERLERESDVSVVQTAPTVTFEVTQTDGAVLHIASPSELPDPSQIRQIAEPIVHTNVIIPNEFVGALMKLAQERRGTQKKQEYLSATRVMMTYEFPLSEIIYDFYDRLKSITRGYGTMDYELKGFRPDRLVRLDILVNGVPVDALSVIVHREKAEYRGRRLIGRLHKEIARHQFEIPIQAAIGGKIIARETIKAFRKDVTAKCYGGDVTRKRKLLEKQKAGKRRMKTVGRVDIPQEAFMAVLDPGE